MTFDDSDGPLGGHSMGAQGGDAGRGSVGEDEGYGGHDFFPDDAPSFGEDRGDSQTHRLVSADDTEPRDFDERQRPRKGRLLGPLADAAEEMAPRKIFGEIPRKRFNDTARYPYRAICALIPRRGGREALGTGWFISSNIILTAGHNLYNNPQLPRGWVESIEVRPGANGWQQAPYGIHHVRRQSQMKVSSEWLSANDPTLDFGIIIMDQPLADRTGSFQIAPAFGADELSSMRLNVIGYPGDIHPPLTLWGNNGFVIREGVRQRTLRYRMDTAGGQSGAPLIFVPDNHAAGQPVYAVGIHNNAFSSFNSATRITEGVIRTIMQWIG